MESNRDGDIHHRKELAGGSVYWTVVTARMARRME
jgi:hypothetical protein